MVCLISITKASTGVVKVAAPKPATLLTVAARKATTKKKTVVSILLFYFNREKGFRTSR